MTQSTSVSHSAQAKYRKDYQQPDYLIPTTELTIELHPSKTLITTTIQVVKNGSHDNALELDSEVKLIKSISINGQAASKNDYRCTDGKLVIDNVVNDAEVTIVSIVDPESNSSLEGLYLSAGSYCTQCEAEGFRKISPFLDRPDVLSTFTVNIIADESVYPHLLANGNLVKKNKDVNSGLTCATWLDPFPKPCYLFAMVAGDFDLLQDSFVTHSGRKVALEIYVDKGNLHLSHHAMSSLKKSMEWDEKKYGLEYDLDVYMIVAVDFFNMGAMENKGLNVFNSKYVLADQKTATDIDYHGIEAVIGHEYFHNWTGNRVTCRDWFQLSLKEGLTVFRDQQFSADMGTPVIERISHANVMRTMQFNEDAGPMSHPIRPDKVIEMNNFYTVTVYDKGAEVIRMMNTLLGEEGFRLGMDLYFERHDGNAVTCDDFVSAMEDANRRDLSKFSRWYSQSGTPVVSIEERQVSKVDQIEHTIVFKQHIYDRTDDYLPLTIPVKYEVLDQETGASIDRSIFIFDKQESTLTLTSTRPVVVVLFEDFSAPVKVKRTLSLDDMNVVIRHASDPFCRWDMLQTLWQLSAHEITAANPTDTDVAGGDATESLIANLSAIINDADLDDGVKAELIRIPAFQSFAESFDVIPVEGILATRNKVATLVAVNTYKAIKINLEGLVGIENAYEKDNIAARALSSSLMILLAYNQELSVRASITTTIDEWFTAADNMTDKMTAINAAVVFDISLLNKLLDKLYSEFRGQPLVFDKICQAVASVNNENVYSLMADWAQKVEFDVSNPNRVRSLYGAFVMRNASQFHQKSGRGYDFLHTLLVDVDAKNPQLAARLIDPLLAFKRYDEHRSKQMKNVLEQLSAKNLSKDLYEKVQAALDL